MSVVLLLTLLTFWVYCSFFLMVVSLWIVVGVGFTLSKDSYHPHENIEGHISIPH